MTLEIIAQKLGEVINSKEKTYSFYLYIAGSSPRSQQAVINVQKLCEVLGVGSCNLKIIDVFQQPQVAKDDQIIVVPTLLRKNPKPIRIFIGDMSNHDEILLALGDERDGSGDGKEDPSPTTSRN